MSAKTKIVVLHTKEIIYTGIFVALGIIFIILLIMMIFPNKSKSDPHSEGNIIATGSDCIYIPGIYTTELILGNQTIDVEVIVGKNTIDDIRLVNLSEVVTTMYPLLEPAFESICNQIYETQNLDNITYSADSKYTSLVLLETIQNSLDKARIAE